MKVFFLVLISGLALVNAIPAYQRFERDVSHLDLSYLPPQLPPLKKYLPPVEAKQSPASKQLPASPSNEYLPPIAAKDVLVATAQPDESTTLADFPRAEEKTEILPPINEYLPPAAEIKVATEKPEPPTNEYLPPIQMGADISEIPLEPVPQDNGNKEIIIKTSNHAILEESSGEEVVSLNAMPQDTAIKDVDGYHYKKPDILPDLFTPTEEAKAEYLPPLENGVEGPLNGKSAVLESNGYVYRAIKRLF